MEALFKIGGTVEIETKQQTVMDSTNLDRQLKYAPIVIKDIIQSDLDPTRCIILLTVPLSKDKRKLVVCVFLNIVALNVIMGGIDNQ